jgi:hypothetical protein
VGFRRRSGSNASILMIFPDLGVVGGLETGCGAVIFLPKLKTKLLFVLFCFLPGFCSARTTNLAVTMCAQYAGCLPRRS